MRGIPLGLLVMAALLMPTAATSDGDLRRGALVYRSCVACHALEPGLNLTGPGLGNVLNRGAGAAPGYARYSSGLKEAAFEWNPETLDAWLQDPEGMVPGTYMAFPGIDDAAARADLIAFLEVVGSSGGAERAVADGLMPAEYLRALAPPPLGDAPPDVRVAAVRHCSDSYFVTTQDGRETPYWEKNLRLKIDSTESGPPPGVAILVGSGMQGDRFSMIFSSLADLTSLLQEKC